MAKKMYYTEEEVAEKLGVSVDELANLVRDGKLRSYQDGDRKMYNVEEVDALASGGEEEEIELAPVDTSTGDVASISEADKPAETGKEDTVITAEGISIFDDEDLEIEAADPLAKTQIAPSIEDQISLEGVGSGSGLLDLTRESDDTSLAEVLDHIDMGEGGVGSSIGGEAISEPEPYAPGAARPIAAEPMIVEEIDPTAGLFGGLLVGATVMMLILGGVMLATLRGMGPGFIQGLSNNIATVLGGGVALVIIAGAVGLFVGKSAAAKSQAMRNIGR